MTQQQWLDWRKGGIGSSDAAVIMKLFPYGKTPHMLWEERVYDLETPSSPAMKHGKRNEERALDWFEKETDTVLFRQIRAQDTEYPWLRATLDGFDVNQNCAVEAKCPYNLSNHKEIKKTKKIPHIYFPQCQHQMRAKGLDAMFFLSFNHEDEEDSIILEVKRDEEYIERMIKEEEEMWNCIVNKIPPLLTEKDFSSLEDPECEELLREWQKESEICENSEKRKKEIREKILKFCGNKSSKGFGFSVVKSIVHGKIDYEQAFSDYLNNMRAHYPHVEFPEIALYPYRKEGFTKWTIRSIDKKKPLP